jgi:dipeptidyl-peptidase-4
MLLMLAVSLIAGAGAQAQSRLKDMPGHQRWAELAPQIPKSVTSAAITPVWEPDSKSFTYTYGGKTFVFDVEQRTATEKTDAAGAETRPTPPEDRPLVLARGRGVDANVMSPNQQLRAFSRDMNVWLSAADGSGEKRLSTDGSTATRIRHGVGSYVYLEEFSVSSPVWWSPDSRKVAWMRYDESKVDDYFLQLDQTKMFSTVHTQAYPHPGKANPVADLIVHDIETGTQVRMDTRAGQPFTDDVLGHYIWDTVWTKDSSEILVRRADRLQKVQDLAACNPTTGSCRSVVREERRNAWANTFPPVFLNDGKRFVWTSDRTGFRHLYLYHLDGRMLARLTRGDFDVSDIVRADEANGLLWYRARSGDNHMKIQLHRVGLDGRNDRRVTDPTLHHRTTLAPNNRWFVDVGETHNSPPVATLRDTQGRAVAAIAATDMARFDQLGLKRPEMFTFKSADGVTELHGVLHFPSNFDPSRRYPLLLGLYGGPETNGADEVFATPSTLTELGFIVADLDSRAAEGKGRKALDTIYQQLGIAEIDDFAAGIRALNLRPYIDSGRVGVFGTSYGGMVAALMLMRYPDLVQAASASSPVTDYRLYDTAYSERYLGLPETSPGAYDRSAVLTYVNQLKGDLLIYYGTSDDNVHPKNALFLIKALQQAGKSFDVQVGPDRGHTTVNQQRMMEFFIERLVLRAARTTPDAPQGPAVTTPAAR